MSKGNRNRGKGDSPSGVQKFIVPIIVLALIVVGIMIWKPWEKDPKCEAFVEQKPVAALDTGIVATIYFDNSFSMKGYADANDNNVYLDVLSDLRAFYPGTVARVDEEEIPGNELIDRIRRHQITYTQESLLYEDLKMIAADAQQALCDTLNPPQRLNFYITDGIMSGSDEDIKIDREHNKIHAQDLQNQIKDALKGNDKIGISVYQFKSPFVGTYWAYDNSKQELKGTQRYFYVIAMGSREALAGFKCKADAASLDQKGSKFHPLAQWHAIDAQLIRMPLSVSPIGALTQLQEGCACYTFSPKVINTQHNRTISFSMDTDALVNYYIEDMDSLAAACIVEIDNNRCQDFPVAWDAANRKFTFSVTTDRLGKRSVVRLSVPRLEMKWIDKSSNPDDKYMLGPLPDARTFLFDKFMQGILGAFPDAASETIFQSEVTLFQK